MKIDRNVKVRQGRILNDMERLCYETRVLLDEMPNKLEFNAKYKKNWKCNVTKKNLQKVSDNHSRMNCLISNLLELCSNTREYQISPYVTDLRNLFMAADPGVRNTITYTLVNINQNETNLSSENYVEPYVMNVMRSTEDINEIYRSIAELIETLQSKHELDMNIVGVSEVLGSFGSYPPMEIIAVIASTSAVVLSLLNVVLVAVYVM